jgi:cytochrome c biogenesis protein CcdA
MECGNISQLLVGLANLLIQRDRKSRKINTIAGFVMISVGIFLLIKA